jgi:hypothetical protein
MNVNQITGSCPMNAVSQRNVQPLTMEISPEDYQKSIAQKFVNFNLSGEAVNLYELSQMYPDVYQSNIKFSGDVLHKVERSVLLIHTMKTMRLESGEMPSANPLFRQPFDLNELTAAYDRVMQTTNMGNRHLDDAFRDFTRMIISNPAVHNARNDWWEIPAAAELNRSLNPKLTDAQRASQNEFIDIARIEAERQAKRFADVFLDNYKKHGMEEAFNMAIAAITQ